MPGSAPGGYILWDFDGTLAERFSYYYGWDDLVLETLEVHRPNHGVTSDDVLPALIGRFPWNSTVPHPELSTPEAWWASVDAVLAHAFELAGATASEARELAAEAHGRYVDPTIGWRLLDDVVPALHGLSDRGWAQIVLSNHVPELNLLVDGLGIRHFFENVISSAEIGYEKPHPGAFAAGVACIPKGCDIWVIGDNYEPDVAGAAAVGLRSILVRSEHPLSRNSAPDLLMAMDILLAQSSS